MHRVGPKANPIALSKELQVQILNHVGEWTPFNWMVDNKLVVLYFELRFLHAWAYSVASKEQGVEHWFL